MGVLQVHAQLNSLSVGGIVPRVDAVSHRGNAPFHEVFRVPFGISILTIQLTVGRLAIHIVTHRILNHGAQR